MAYKVIDVSYFQGLNIDWQAVKDFGVEGVIVRCGQIEKGIPSIDSTFETNYSGAKSVGLHIGSYYTAGATSFEGIKQEANFFKNQLQGKSFDLPVYVDLEDDGDQSFLHANCDSAIQIFKDNLEGYNFGIYAPFDWYKNYIDEERWKDIPLWIAQYDDTMTFQPNYFGMWQKTKTGKINGIGGNVDINECYIAYWDRTFSNPIVVDDNIVSTLEVINLGIEYEVFFSGKEWSATQRNGGLVGSEGQSQALDKIRLRIINPENKDVHVHYQVHSANIGWSGFVADGTDCGTFGYPIEAIMVALRGNDVAELDLAFRAHIQNSGDMNWASGDGKAGSEGGGLRLEAFACMIVPKGVDLSVGDVESFVQIQQMKETAKEVEDSNGVDNGDGYGQYFVEYEFACDCIKGYNIPSPCDGFPQTSYGKNPNIHSRLIEVANLVRSGTGGALNITSATRCTSANNYWGGVVDSLHLIGEAFDCYSSVVDALTLARYVANNFKDIGVRYYPSRKFCHLEIGTSLAGVGVYDQENYYFI